MTEFAHARCGGRLIPIPRPSWDVWDDSYARCDRCHRPGVVEPGSGNMPRRFSWEEAERVRREYLASPLTHDQYALSIGVSAATLYDVVDRRGAYDLSKEEPSPRMAEEGS